MDQNIVSVGVQDLDIRLFEGQFFTPKGMAYNSYLIKDEKTAVMDSVERSFAGAWLENIDRALGGAKPDYLIVQHMEPDHSGSIADFMARYPQAVIVSSAKAFSMMQAFYGSEWPERRVLVKEGDALSLGKHSLRFIAAPMVHWPEVLMTLDETTGTLFSADAFGRFGAGEGESDACVMSEARRYYFGIVGKFGAQVRNVLKKLSGSKINVICPLHGTVLEGDLSPWLNAYSTWADYAPESEGVAIAFTSVYGNTRKAVELLASMLAERGCPKTVVTDLTDADQSRAVAEAFRFGKLVLASTTYNGEVFPAMRSFIEKLAERNYQKRTVALIENGSWAPMAAKTMHKMLDGCKNLTFTDTTVKITSALNDESKQQIEDLANELCKDYLAQRDETANKNDLAALFKIGYGLYVVTTNDGKKDNGLIVNTVSQVTSTPNRVAVTINKDNYSHHVIKQTGILNVNCLSVEAPFGIFETFGFQSGRNKDKFEGWPPLRSDNGLAFLPMFINAFMSLKVEQYVDLGTHGMFICAVTEARVINDKETMTYTYYQNNVKPKPKTEGKKGFVCKICGYVYEGDELPDDFICPLCKHGAADFEPIS